MAWAGKTAVVTGVARPTAIGHACAHILHKQGYNIVGIDIHEPQAVPDPQHPNHLPWTTYQQQQKQQQPSGSPDCVFLQLDLSQPAAIQAVPQQLQGLGIESVETLVNNAGICDPYLPPPAADGSNAGERAAMWSKYIAVNLSAPFLLSEALLPLLSKKEGERSGGSIIHISSTRALQSEPHSEGYGAAKAGLLGLTHAQAASLADRGIRVNAILPGWIDTTDPAENGGRSELRPEDHAWHWVGRVGVPADVAEMVAFLADNSKSGFITGQQFVVDGGVAKRMTYPEEYRGGVS